MPLKKGTMPLPHTAPVIGLLWCALLVCTGPVNAQRIKVVSESVRGTIYRSATHVTVDQYTLEISTPTALVEFDILSAETADNVTFTDVNGDCDSAFIDSQIYLYKRQSSGELQLVAYNDDEGDDSTRFYGRGRRDGSLNTQDSYMIRELSAGTYMLAVGRYPLSSLSARAGKSTEDTGAYSPYACQSRQASYGNYQLTVRVGSTSSVGVITAYPESYVGNSCSTAMASATRECIYALPGDFASAIQKVCRYDKTVASS